MKNTAAVMMDNMEVSRDFYVVENSYDAAIDSALDSALGKAGAVKGFNPAVAKKLISIIVKILFLGCWGYGLFAGGALALFCILCGIVVLAVTTIIG